MSRQTPFPPSVSYHHHISAALGEENRTGEEGSPKRKREKEEKRDTTGLIPASEVTPTDGLPQNAAAAQYLGGGASLRSALPLFHTLLRRVCNQAGKPNLSVPGWLSPGISTPIYTVLLFSAAIARPPDGLRDCSGPSRVIL